MIRLVRSEIRKVCGPLLLWVTMAMAIGAVVVAVMSHETSSSDLKWAQENARSWENGQSPTPEEVGMVAGAEYDQWVADSKQDAQRYYLEAKSGSAIARSTQSPLGAGGLAAATVGSALGAFALLLLAGFHVSGEWSRNSIKETMLQSGRRVQFIVAKLVSLWLVGLWLLLVSWVVLVLWGLVSQHVFPIPADHSSEAVGWSLALIAKAPLTILLVASLGVVAGILMRNPIGSLALSTFAVLVTAFLPTVNSTLAKLSPPVWIADWMDFRQRDFLVYFWWLRKVRDVSLTYTGLAMIALVCVSMVVAAVVMKRRDVLG